MRIKEYTRVDSLEKTDAFVVETASGTRYVEQQDLGYMWDNGGTIRGDLDVRGSMTLESPLPVTSGGSGITSNPSMLTNLGSTTAAGVFTSAPRPGITGTLGVAHGGTGLTASPSMLVNLGSTSAANVMAASPRPGITGTLGVAHGGTGVTTSGALGLISYPVGSIYIAYNSTSPASRFGGTWTQITGRFLRAANDVSTGGADTVTLKAAQSGLPAHSHSVYFKDAAGTGVTAISDPIAAKSSKGGTGYLTTTSADAASSHTNMPAYQDLYVWRRTA